MRKVVGYLVISIFVALLMTSTTFFVGEFVMASVSGGAGGSTSGTVSGFPIPYATFFPCCSGSGGPDGSVFYNSTYFYQPLNFVADFSIWFATSLDIILTFTLTTFLLAAGAGLGVTLFTLLLPPLSIVRPTPALETAVLRPMGFPYEYLTYYVSGLLGATNSGYEFALSPALADYVLWTGVAAALIGLTVKIIRGRRATPLNPEPPLP
jgi:hypothetical protein